MTPQQKQAYQDFAKEKLGFEFGDIELLITALTHRSYVNEHKKSVNEHNERLEFLGDAVLELVATDFLYNNYSEPEGILTSWRSALVRTESIGAAGELLGYKPLVRMSRGEKNGSERAHQQILANAFEAVIGAIYLDKGYDQAQKFIADNILLKLDQILEEDSWRDPKSHLQEIVQREDGVTPNYRVISEEGPDHDKTFTLGVYVGDKLISKGNGPSKQAAQQEAATKAIVIYKKR
ncbi:MAG: ribonuclease III [Candidatus Nomurabacteria bacterium]|jgi:ribonuclease-3|nr:ribonuclease III [Candidatus Nomurabacteria bacterium]